MPCLANLRVLGRMTTAHAQVTSFVYASAPTDPNTTDRELANLADARSNLGQSLLENGQTQEALLHCQEAVRLCPTSSEALNHLGNVLRVRILHVPTPAPAINLRPVALHELLPGTLVGRTQAQSGEQRHAGAGTGGEVHKQYSVRRRNLNLIFRPFG